MLDENLLTQFIDGMKSTVCIVMSLLTGAWLAHAALAQTTSARKNSVWVPPPTGSLIGGGYAAVPEASRNFKSRMSVNEAPVIRTAIDGLDTQADTIVEGWSLIAPAVAWQADVSVKTLNAQRTKAEMSYGELLVANSLAKTSGQTFETILGMKQKAATWGQLAKQLKINPDSIAIRARKATESIRFAEARRRNRRQQNMKDSGFNQGGGDLSKIPGFGGG